MLGGSLIRAAKAAVSLGMNETLSMVAMDPFVGDVNMWASESGLAHGRRFRFLQLEKARRACTCVFMFVVKAPTTESD